MRTVIFATDAETDDVQRVLGGQIFTRDNILDIVSYTEDNEDAVIIVADEWMFLGWRFSYPTQILFSKDFPKDPDIRTQIMNHVYQVSDVRLVQ